MRIIIILLPLISHADIEYKVAKAEYRWWNKASFPVTIHTIGYSHFINDIELSVSLGKSTTAYNSVKSGYKLSSKIDNLESYGIGYRYKTRYVICHIGWTYTEYVEGMDEWKNEDMSFGYYFGLSKPITKDLYIKLIYNHYYDKIKPQAGREVTAATGIALIYR